MGAGTGTQATEVYKRACAIKADRYACGIFGSTAISDSDGDTIGAFALCEGGRYEACEDYAARAKSPPLIAWLESLKADGCRNGAQALCPSEKQCRGKARWGCDFTPRGDQVCGCIPVCEGPREVAAGERTWKDGTRRGIFTCVPPHKR